MKTYFAIQSFQKSAWQTLCFSSYDNGIGFCDELYARAWLELYPQRKWRIVKRIVKEEILGQEEVSFWRRWISRLKHPES